ncbi:hypothetical protein NDU88_003396 [Pleurodeles waltl]|uniref:Uncharacterized protein n=1 Tax=Pleurodeles waltl TaxID=8319 RepID=A0AAV7UDX5_PLEWA|nr:hypothetical protein NDU88_003396 [Pleurodeles waltl]
MLWATLREMSVLKDILNVITRLHERSYAKLKFASLSQLAPSILRQKEKDQNRVRQEETKKNTALKQ